MPEHKPRLLYLATFNPTLGATGTTTRGKLFLRHLVDRFEIHVVCFQRSDEGPSDPELIRRLGSFQCVPQSQLGYFLLSPSLYRLAAQVIERVQPAMIFADFEKAGLYARLLARRHRLRYVYNSHNVEYLRYLDLAKRYLPRYLLVPWIYFAERFGAAGAVSTIVISQDDARVFRRWLGPGRVMVKPAAFDEAQFNPFFEAEPTARPTVLMVGNFGNPANSRGARALVERVVPLVAARKPDVLFRFVGRSFPAELSHPNVQVAGFVEDLMEEYQRAAVVLVPIEMGGGIKIKLIEGLACGCSVVATPKAMEGVENRGFECLRIGELTEFPRLILEALETGPRRTTCNWEAMRAQFGTGAQLEAIARLLAAGGPITEVG